MKPTSLSPTVPVVTINPTRGQVIIDRPNGDSIILSAPTDPEACDRLAGRIRGALADAFHAGSHETERLLREHP